MSVYVDDMRSRHGRMIMCHMVADTSNELDAMADRVGVARRWRQHGGTPAEHYDISLSKRSLAVAAGAKEITQREAVALIRKRRGAAEMSCDICQESIASHPGDAGLRAHVRGHYRATYGVEPGCLSTVQVVAAIFADLRRFA